MSLYPLILSGFERSTCLVLTVLSLRFSCSEPRLFRCGDVHFFGDGKPGRSCRFEFCRHVINFFISQLAISPPPQMSFYCYVIICGRAGHHYQAACKERYLCRDFCAGLRIVLIILFITSRSSFEGLFPSVMKGSRCSTASQLHRRGLDITAIVYFVMVSFVFVFLTIQSLEKRRWN